MWTSFISKLPSLAMAKKYFKLQQILTVPNTNSLNAAIWVQLLSHKDMSLAGVCIKSYCGYHGSARVCYMS